MCQKIKVGQSGSVFDPSMVPPVVSVIFVPDLMFSISQKLAVYLNHAFCNFCGCPLLLSVCAHCSLLTVCDMCAVCVCGCHTDRGDAWVSQLATTVRYLRDDGGYTYMSAMAVAREGWLGAHCLLFV